MGRSYPIISQNMIKLQFSVHTNMNVNETRRIMFMIMNESSDDWPADTVLTCP